MPTVVLVHGTWSGPIHQPEPTDREWWSKKSTFSSSLAAKLKKSETDFHIDDSFCWSGENRTSDRLDAAIRLLAYIKVLEETNEEYHLIGHSHGGTIIWQALQNSIELGFELKSLKSWSTVSDVSAYGSK